MALILALGSNLGDREKNLLFARNELNKILTIKAESRIFESAAVDFLDQPDFYNQVVEYELPDFFPEQLLENIMQIEKILGRERTIAKGPRLIDIDILFWGLEKINQDNLIVPHYAWQDRSFVVLPLQDLPYFKTIRKSFIIPSVFKNSAKPI